MNSRISFHKMHALGNDFVIVNAQSKPLNFTALAIQKITNRHTGIGCDQLLILNKSTRAHFLCHIFNADGSKAEQCGNGLRCIAKLAHQENWFDFEKDSALTLETSAGIYSLTLVDRNDVCLNMGIPVIEKTLLDLTFNNFSGSDNKLTVLNLGNPHAIFHATNVVLTDPVTDTLALAIAKLEYFPQGVNVGMMEVCNQDHIRLRTFERGVGETLACGSNACAAAIAGITNHGLNRRVKVEFKLGFVWVEWAGEGSPVYLTGPATHVYSGWFDCSLDEFHPPGF